jgi:hypothetical protein
MPLACIVPTRLRWRPWLVHQLDLLAPQLAADDAIVIVCDCDTMPPEVFEQAREQFGPRLTIVQLSYARADVPDGCVNRARRAGVAVTPLTHDVVEVDDHDPLERNALASIRTAFEAGADYVLSGRNRQQAIIEGPDRRLLLEVWPSFVSSYTPGAFARCELEPIAPRAIRRSLWEKLGGWNDAWPQGDLAMAQRAEAIGAKIECLMVPLATVTVDADSVSGQYRGQRPEPAEAG